MYCFPQVRYDKTVAATILSIFAPAKINLHLAVKERRPDGFHNLESVFLALDWGDNLLFERKDSGIKGDELIIIRGNARAEQKKEILNIPDNIILRALALFREKTGFSEMLKITVEKHIPLGGGLGGGSSDAAAALLALNKIAGSPLSKDALLETGAALGSDVPFFLHETQAAWVTGRGENIEPLKMPEISLVLVNPGFSSDTAEAYRLLDEYRVSEESYAEVRRHREEFKILLPLRLYVSARDSSPISSFYNDFLPVFGERERTIYNKICCNLREFGAQFAGLSGAGSTCFGVFEEMEQAQKAAETLRGEWNFVHCCNSLI